MKRGDRSRRLTEDEALQLWKRAAELEETRRREAEGALLSGESSDPSTGVAGTDAEAGVSLDVARAAAIESGIDARVVDDASLVLAAEQHLDAAAKSELPARMLGVDSKPLEVSVRLKSTPAKIRAAVAATASTPAFSMTPIDIIEQDDGRMALIYEVSASLESLVQESFSYQVYWTSEVKRIALLVSCEDDHCNLTAHVATGRNLKMNAIASGVFQLVLGGAAATAVLVGSTITGLASGGMAGVLTGAGALVAAAGAALGARVGYQALFRRSRRNLKDALRSFLTAVRMRVDE